ncbi:NADH-quinone oxidoreductase subunit N [Longitalea luteola]|uniref:NADH-quinone oxidoreductase subunit N n=1 Tax=Longitalea luteola TaxID=2812563 RepID=UPI001A95D345|nr:NADH-quinone oxidoreductase subunit N [Longitalea luteola]
MTNLQLLALLPFMVLATAAVVVILLIAFKQSHTVIQVTGFFMMCAVVLAMWFVRDTLPREVPPLLVVDGLAALFTGLIIFSVLVVGLLSYIYFEEREENPKEYYILLFLATLGAAVLTISRHFISFFIGLELLSVSLYALIAYLRNRNNAIEAGVKYLMLAALTSAFLLFGMALIYMETGSMEFTAIGNAITKSGTSVLFLMGIGLIVVAIGFKLALVPFHLWAADVYQGAPAPVTAFIATVSKIGVFAVFVRFAQAIHLHENALAVTVLTVIAIACMIAGNVLALMQQNIKRLLAYSSIAHFGYLLVAFLSGDAGVGAGVFYLLAYSITLLSAFGIITLLSTRRKDADELSGYRGLFWRNPLMAAIFTVALLSLAGIPLTAGFPAKFFILTVGVQQHMWLLAVVLVLTSVIGLYYYLRIISTLFASPPLSPAKEKSLHPLFYAATYTSLVVLMFLLAWLGIFPGFIIDNVQEFLVIR